MVAKFYLIASLALVLFVYVSAKKPSERRDVDPEDDINSDDLALNLEEDLPLQENIRQKREPNNNGKGNGVKKSSKGKEKGVKKSSRGKGKPVKKSSRGKGKAGKKSSRGKGKAGNKSSRGKGKAGKKSSRGKANAVKKSSRGNGKANKKSSRGKGKAFKKSSRGKGKTAKKSSRGKGKTAKKSSRSKGKAIKKSSKGRGKAVRKSSKGNGKNNRPPVLLHRQKQSNATVKLLCLRDSVTFTKFLKDNVINFLRRNTRLEAQNNLTNKKAGKKGEFKEPAARLIQAGGGDRTNLSCAGSTTSVGAKSMAETVTTLDDCNAAIKDACKPPEANTTMLKECKKNAVVFNTTVSGCIKKATQGKDACSCFQDSEVLKEKKVLEKCKGTAEGKAAAKARTKCLKALSKCKTAATEAGKLQYACSFTTDKLIKNLKTLNANLAAFKAFLDKIKKLTGLSPMMPGGAPTTNATAKARSIRSDEVEDEEEEVFEKTNGRVRGKRQEVACSTILVSIKTCTTQIKNTPAMIKVVTSCKAPTYTISTCTDDDKKNIQSALNSAIETNGIIIAFIDSIKAELKLTTGSTPKPGDTKPDDTTAKAAARSRNMLRKMIMEKIQLRN